MMGKLVKALLAALALWLVVFMTLPRLAPHRSARWLVATTSTLGALVTRISSSDSGLLRDQLSTRFLLLEPGMIPLEQRAQGLRIGDFATSTDQFLPTAAGWDLRIGGDGVTARVVMRGADEGEAGEGRARGKATNIEGFARFSADVRRITGWGLVVEAETRGRVQGTALYAMDAGLTLVVDPILAGDSAWYVWQGQSWAGEASAIGVDQPFQVGELRVVVKLLEGKTLAGFGHLLAPERAVAWAVGVFEPLLTVFRASVRVGEEGVDHAAVVLVRE